jgi:hypothetical protein
MVRHYPHQDNRDSSPEWRLRAPQNSMARMTDRLHGADCIEPALIGLHAFIATQNEFKSP